MSNVAFLLGPVQFQDFEIPERIGFGTEQHLAVHELPGGARVIDALGPRPAEIAWSGIFSGPDATGRARMLDALLAQGSIVTLSWDVFFYSVVLHRFSADYRNTAWVPYSLRCTVVPDDAATLAGVVDALAADVLADALSGFGFSAQAGLDLGGLQASLAAPGASVAGTTAWLAAGNALAGARAGVQQGLTQSGIALGAPLGNAADVTTMIGQCGNVALFSTSAAFLGRAAANLEDGSD